MIYTLDTNVIVVALRQPHELDRLKSYLSWALSFTVLSAVVAAELMAGARTDRARRILGDAVLGPFARRGRIVAPTAAARRRTGEYLSHLDLGGNSVGRQSDALLASQARELGWVVVTRDRDFESLRAKITGLRVAAPYPER